MRLGLLLPLTAVAALTACGPPMVGSFQQQPPAKYRGDGLVAVEFVDPDKIPALCVAGTNIDLGANKVITACVKGAFMYLPNPCTWPNDSDYRQIACHELGHRNGWPANHPAS